MKKKFLCVGLILALALSISACGVSVEDSLDLYNTATKNMQSAKDADASMSMNMKINASGQSQTVKMSGDYQQVMKSKDNMELAMDMNMDAGSIGSYDMKLWYKDGYMYMDAMNSKIKSKTDFSTAMGMANAGAASNMKITEDMVEEVSQKEDGDNTTIEFTIKADKIKDLLSKANEKSSGTSGYFDSVKSGDMTITVVIDKDKLMKSVKVKSTLKTEISGTSADMDYDISVDYKSVNSGLTIDFPDFSKYKTQNVGV